ncbi:MAG: hypothetical protein R3190_14665, partial [Thermoanaerobaculia bacterium]|nr:hypothetical protein [Thermoanaerobaculia bacterium]
MSYQGDSSLASDIQDRVLSTFDQTTQLARDGKLQEAKLGCDFILRLDPHFEPAKTLQEKLDGADGPVELDDAPGDADAAMASPEVLKTVALSQEELDKLMAAEDNGNDEAPADLEAAAAEAAPEAASPEPETGAEPSPPPAAAEEAAPADAEEAPKRVGKVQIGGNFEAPGVAARTQAADDDAATTETDLASGDRIQQLLDEGQDAYNDERYQEAID